jgi:glycerol-3-phosphate dehydrogenase
MSETAMKLIKPYFTKLGDSWTANVSLPGGDFSYPHQQLVGNLTIKYSWLSTAIAIRYVNQFGTLTWLLLEDVDSEASLGRHFGGGLYRREIDYLIDHEFAKNSEDV